jgi:hypothetical protein
MDDRSVHPAKHSRTNVRAFTLALLLALPLALSLVSRAQSDKDQQAPAKPTGTAEVRIELTAADTKKPIADASVYLKFTQDGLLRDRPIELNLKTNQNGVARSPLIPKGRVLIQIVMPGWKTYGQYFEVDRDEQVIQINLERPTTRWF